MTYSLHPHGILTEPVRETMSGKGREGKGIRKWKGRRVETSHHVVTYVRREPSDGMMALRAGGA